MMAELTDDYQKLLATGKLKYTKNGHKYIEFYAEKEQVKRFLKYILEEENKQCWTNSDGQTWFRFQMWQQRGEKTKFVLNAK